MKIDIEVLLNRKSDRYFLFNINSGIRFMIPVASAHLFTDLVGEDNVESFENITELNRYVEDIAMIKRGETPRPTPSCHRFFADG